jgi:hypothetical protein
VVLFTLKKLIMGFIEMLSSIVDESFPPPPPPHEKRKIRTRK